MVMQPATRRFSVQEYHQMAAAGILTEDDPVELIEGEIVEMPPIGSRHAACLGRLNRLFSAQVGDLALVRIQDPIHLGERSEPQPDLALVKLRVDFYAASHPAPDDVLLIVEVADTSAGYDQFVKVPLYARAGIREVWLVNLAQDRLDVFRDPAAGRYRTVQTFRRGDQLRPGALPHLDVTVDAILG